MLLIEEIVFIVQKVIIILSWSHFRQYILEVLEWNYWLEAIYGDFKLILYRKKWKGVHHTSNYKTNWQRHFTFLWYFMQKLCSRNTFGWIQTNFARSFQRKNSLILVDSWKWPQLLLVSYPTLTTKQICTLQSMETLYILIKFIIKTITSFIDGLCYGLSKHEIWKICFTGRLINYVSHQIVNLIFNFIINLDSKKLSGNFLYTKHGYNILLYFRPFSCYFFVASFKK